MYVRKSRQLGGILLVSGTTIGAGMLALPVTTGLAGFFPSLAIFIFYWLMSLITAFLFLEVNLWFAKPVNLVTMARFTLGRHGAAATWVFYLLLLYALTAAYLAAGGEMFLDLVGEFYFFKIEPWMKPLPFLILFGAFIYLGTRPVDYLNRILMTLLVAFYIALLAISLKTVDEQKLLFSESRAIFMAIPIIVTSFGFHIVIPSLTTYLDRNVKVLKRVLLIGSSIPLLAYLAWEYVVLGSIPLEGSFGLKEALKEGKAATYSLAHLLNNPWITTFSQCFAFFAILTSFLGVSLSLSHFLMDGLKIRHAHKGKMITFILTFLPPLGFVLFYPQGFILALDYAGIFVAILLGILPVIMAWVGRSKHDNTSTYKVWGGRFTLILAAFAYMLVILIVFKERLYS